MERAAIDENIIKEKKNKVYSKTEDQKNKNRSNQNENDLKIQQYKKMIELKSAFLKFSDERKETQNRIAQEAKNDSLDKQEVERRKTLKLLMLYNQYLRTLMDEELKNNEELEKIFEQIRDICGTKNLDEIVDFIMLRNKRYNYACQEVKNCEDKNKKLKKEIKELKEELTHLKNNLLVQEKDGKELDVELSTNPEEDSDIIEKEKQENKNLLGLGKRFNEIDEAYHLVIQNISTMIENGKQNGLITEQDNQEGDNEQFELTNDELKEYNKVEFTRKEKKALNNYNLTGEEKLIVDTTKVTDKDKKEIEKMELSELDKVVRCILGDQKLTDEEKEIAQEIYNTQLTEDEEKKAKNIILIDSEEKIACQKLENDTNELTSDEKKNKLEEFKKLKIKFNKYKEQEIKESTGYKIKKMKKNKADMIKNYENLLQEIEKRYEKLILLRNKQELINILKEKGVKEESSQEHVRNNRKKGTRKVTKRLGTNGRYLKTEQYKIITENKDEEDDKSNYDPDVKILNKFLKEQKKEKENFITGKVKIAEEKK